MMRCDVRWLCDARQMVAARDDAEGGVWGAGEAGVTNGVLPREAAHEVCHGERR